MKLYYIQRYNDVSEAYKEGEVLRFDKKNPNALREDMLDLSSSYVYRTQNTDRGQIKLCKDLDDLLVYEELKNKSEEEVRKILNLVSNYICKSSVQRRELILEEVRREINPKLPSRYSCMWLTDEECLDSWMELLYPRKGHYDVFEVEAKGNVFVSTDDLLPALGISTRDMYAFAEDYWKCTKEQAYNSIKREYLFEGEAKILRKVQ